MRFRTKTLSAVVEVDCITLIQRFGGSCPSSGLFSKIVLPFRFQRDPKRMLSGIKTWYQCIIKHSDLHSFHTFSRWLGRFNQAFGLSQTRTPTFHYKMETQRLLPSKVILRSPPLPWTPPLPLTSPLPPAHLNPRPPGVSTVGLSRGQSRDRRGQSQGAQGKYTCFFFHAVLFGKIYIIYIYIIYIIYIYIIYIYIYIYI